MTLFALDRQKPTVYEILPDTIPLFLTHHLKNHLQTDILIIDGDQQFSNYTKIWTPHVYA